MSSVKTNTTTEKGRAHWRSLDELANTPSFQKWAKDEFPGFADTIASEMASPVSRRKFMTLMGASFALAGATACVRRPEEKILPYGKAPEYTLPGIPSHYASASVRSGFANGIVVESNTGRPTKIEGNANHPSSRGGADALTLATILGLYDPDRSHGVVNPDVQYTNLEEFFAFAGPHFDELRKARGKGLAFLSTSDASPTQVRLRAEIAAALPQASWHTYEPINWDGQHGGSTAAFGQPMWPIVDLSKAQVVLSLDSDFLTSEPGSLAMARDFADGRRLEGKKKTMNRLWSVEGYFSTTGAVADHRLRVPPTQVEAFSWDLAAALSKRGVTIPGAGSIKAPGGFAGDWLNALADDLVANKGKSIVMAGYQQPASVHALVAAMNEGLSNVGKTITYVESALASEGLQEASLKKLVEGLNKGTVSTLVVMGGNPAYDAPADLNFVEAMKKASTTIQLGYYWDETGQVANWHVPLSHALESWGDARGIDGTASIVQPLIEPLFESVTSIELLGFVLGGERKDGYDLVQDTWTKDFQGLSFEKAWRRWLHDGVVAGSAYRRQSPAVNGQGVSRALSARKPAAAPSANAMNVIFMADSTVYDGRYNNNAWLQETPDPITKLTWDNAALISPKTAEAIGVGFQDKVTITLDGRSLEIAVLVLPGLADNTIVLPLGYGRSASGKVGTGSGFNTYALRGTSGMWHGVGATAAKAAGHYELAVTQDHHIMYDPSLEDGPRPIVREASLEEYKAHPDFAPEMVHYNKISAWEEPDYSQTKNQWGMTIDLNACIGCNACTVACQSENNIAVVGKEEVINGREMSWIRLDRYFTGSMDDPQMVHQPVGCAHCENAPCETVCPVAATVHGVEGTNDMAYNRCIGTRYCANNCPFKVRRFNFLDYHGQVDEMVKMVHNPDVTVRMRGVMEKCTYCTQRIHRAKRKAKIEGRLDLRDGEVTPACAQACPAEAIVFGNINDPNSRVSKLKKRDRNYEMLAELNIQPRTSFLARVRNPHPNLA